MHDGAPAHKSKIVTKFPNDNNINVLEWPGNSPDLNPIENAWNYLKNKSPREETKQYQRSAWGAKKTLGNPGLHLLRLPCWFHAQKALSGHQFKGRDDKILIKCGIKDVNCKIISFEFFVKIFNQCKDSFLPALYCRIRRTDKFTIRMSKPAWLLLEWNTVVLSREQ